LTAKKLQTEMEIFNRK